MTATDASVDPWGRLETFLSLTRSEGSRVAMREAYRYARAGVPGFSTAYWQLAPRWYRWRLDPTVDAYEVPVRIFKRVWVDPNRITRFTGRAYDPPASRWRQFGQVRAGDWDRRGERAIPAGMPGPPQYPELFFADRFEDTVLHRSLVTRFRDGAAWGETAFVRRARELIDAGETVWQDSRSRSDLAEQCARLDDLYESIAADGIKSMLTMARRGEELRSFPSAIANEIVVDIGRDGGLLFANGRHRLSIAKILDLDRIPVAILVRHAEWMARRSDIHRGHREPIGHPDIPTSFEATAPSLEDPAPLSK